MNLLDKLPDLFPSDDERPALADAITHRAPQTEDDPRFLPLQNIGYHIDKLARYLGEQDEWTTQEADAVRLVIAIASHYHYGRSNIVDLFAGNPLLEPQLLEINQTLPPSLRFDPDEIARHLPSCWNAPWMPASSPASAKAPFLSRHANQLWALSDQEITDICKENGSAEGFLKYFSVHRPAVIRAAILYQKNRQHPYRDDQWQAIATATDTLDDAMLDFFLHALDPANMRHDYYNSDIGKMADVFGEVILRNPPTPAIIRIARSRPTAARPNILEYLLTHQPETALADAANAICSLTPHISCPELEKYYTLAKNDLTGDGRSFFTALLQNRRDGLAFDGLLTDPADPEQTRAILLDHATTLEGHDLWNFWQHLLQTNSALFHPEIHTFLRGKSKPLQRHAAQALAKDFPDDVSPTLTALLASKNGQERLGAYEILRAQNTPAAQQSLREAYAAESGKQLQKHLLTILKEQGVTVEEKQPTKPTAKAPQSLEDFTALVTKKQKTIRPPKAPWLDLTHLPSLITTDGTEAEPLLKTYILQKQAQHKVVAPHPDLVPLLRHFPREKNHAFAANLLDQWRSSNMASNTKWALTLVGLFSPDTIIPSLTDPMESWCKANKGKRAEWATQAIALLGTDRALATINSLIQTFRSKRKYIASAARASLQLLADQQNITLDELCDQVTPTLGFDQTAHRVFATTQDDVTAVIQPDFKIHWITSESKKTTTTPKNLTPEAKENLKIIRKELRNTVKLETQRLENALVQQRSWTPQQWNQIFEKHPIMQQFATRLVWQLTPPNNSTPEYFRRYPNGVLANATGDLIDLPDESSASIRIAHPLLLDADSTSLWQDHLQRQKTTPPFPQLARPVNELNPEHTNRTEIKEAENHDIDSSRFRAVLEKRSWSLGPAEDGGWIHIAWRKFPADSLEVHLNINSRYHASSTWGEDITLGTAAFYRSEDPLSHLPVYGDSIPFSEIPPIIYSEIISDLKTITEGQT